MKEIEHPELLLPFREWLVRGWSAIALVMLIIVAALQKLPFQSTTQFNWITIWDAGWTVSWVLIFFLPHVRLFSLMGCIGALLAFYFSSSIFFLEIAIFGGLLLFSPNNKFQLFITLSSIALLLPVVFFTFFMGHFYIDSWLCLPLIFAPMLNWTNLQRIFAPSLNV